MDKFQEKYRIQSHRKPNWDYSETGFYYITFVTQHREYLLGEIKNDAMLLSDFGKIVQNEWLKSFEIRDELFLDIYQIMPNHIHAIVILEKSEMDANFNNNDAHTHDVTETHGVETHGRVSLQIAQSSHSSSSTTEKHIPIRRPKSISSFIGGFKSAVNTKIDDYIDENQLKIPKYNKYNHFFQPNYHDHIICDTAELENIRNYIINNPMNWNNDELH